MSQAILKTVLVFDNCQTRTLFHRKNSAEKHLSMLLHRQMALENWASKCLQINRVEHNVCYFLQIPATFTPSSIFICTYRCSTLHKLCYASLILLSFSFGSYWRCDILQTWPCFYCENSSDFFKLYLLLFSKTDYVL